MLKQTINQILNNQRSVGTITQKLRTWRTNYILFLISCNKKNNNWNKINFIFFRF